MYLHTITEFFQKNKMTKLNIIISAEKRLFLLGHNTNRCCAKSEIMHTGSILWYIKDVQLKGHLSELLSDYHTLYHPTRSCLIIV